MSAVHSVTVDVLNPKRVVIHAVQGDSMRVMQLTLLAGGEPFNVLQDLASGQTMTGTVEYRCLRSRLV